MIRGSVLTIVKLKKKISKTHSLYGPELDLAVLFIFSEEGSSVFMDPPYPLETCKPDKLLGRATTVSVIRFWSFLSFFDWGVFLWGVIPTGVIWKFPYPK